MSILCQNLETHSKHPKPKSSSFSKNGGHFQNINFLCIFFTTLKPPPKIATVRLEYRLYIIESKSLLYTYTVLKLLKTPQSQLVQHVSTWPLTSGHPNILKLPNLLHSIVPQFSFNCLCVPSIETVHLSKWHVLSEIKTRCFALFLHSSPSLL